MQEYGQRPVSPERLSALAQAISTAAGEPYAGKIRELAERARVAGDAVYVAFCGMFSAGKSSLINALCQTDQLATGAVPTTAEVAELVYPVPEGRVVLMDTPGVDSTDESHQAATAAAMHRAHVVALTMDYQHVESEANLALAREFAQQGKRLVVIVHQIDKHLDWELPFSDYQAQVEQAFAAWGIVYEHIFYVSTYDCPYNQLNDLRAYLAALGQDARRIAEEGLQSAVLAVLREAAAQVLAARRQAADDGVLSSVGFLPLHLEEARHLHQDAAARWTQLSDQYSSEQDMFCRTEQSVRDTLFRSVELAQVAPYETTELGRRYIESLRPDFRVGWWLSKQKTEAERKARLAAFCAALQERVQKFLLWPLQNQLRELVQTSEWANPAWLAQADALQVDVSESELAALVKPGALVSERYPYQYVADVVQRIKGQLRGQLTNLLDAWFAEAQDRMAGKLAPLAERVQSARAQMDALAEWIAAAEAEADTVSRWWQLLSEEDMAQSADKGEVCGGSAVS